MIEMNGQDFTLSVGGRVVLSHRPEAPCFAVGRGEARFAMHRGNFEIDDTVETRIPLTHAVVSGNRIALAAAEDAEPLLDIVVEEEGDSVTLAFTARDPSLNRFWMTIPAEPSEHVWGGGEQMSYFDLAGRRFPLWTSESGVGRDKSTAITQEADRTGKAGGDYWTTGYPQPTFVSSRRYALHVDTTAYAVFDFRDPTAHAVEVWEIPRRIELWVRDSFAGLVTALSGRFGRPPPLPDWVIEGAIIGLKDGERSFERLERIRAVGAAVSGLWCEDWAGIRQTSFGRRLFWDWTASDSRYPKLKERIAALAAEGIRFLGYVNPYLCIDGTLFPEAKRLGHLVRDAAGGVLRVDFGEFYCGLVDLTRPEACAWFAERVIGANMLDLGLSGWMADFGEYLPVDVSLASGADPRLVHNAWPVLWAEVNARAIAGRGRTGDALFFMRAGHTGVQAHCPLLWAGDQSVDFSRHDGLVTVICGALSAGLLGNPYHHSDIGGYTSLFGNVRTAELLARWAEMAAFTPVMRTHEGNRPDDNLQIDQDPEVLAHFARMTRIHRALAPYLKDLIAEAAATGLPLQRPLFLHFEEDRRTYAIQDAYLLGPDLLVAPVWQAGATERAVYLPQGARWRHLWSGALFEGGAEVTVAAPLGSPPVFVRDGSPRQVLFERLAAL